VPRLAADAENSVNTAYSPHNLASAVGTGKTAHRWHTLCDTNKINSGGFL
jgi:hypothetical protein